MIVKWEPVGMYGDKDFKAEVSDEDLMACKTREEQIGLITKAVMEEFQEEITAAWDYRLYDFPDPQPKEPKA